MAAAVSEFHAPALAPALAPTRFAPDVIVNVGQYDPWPLDAPGRWVARHDIETALAEARKTLPVKFRKFAECFSGVIPGDGVPPAAKAAWMREALGNAYSSSRGFTSAAQREGATAERRFAESTFAPLFRSFLPSRPSRTENLYGHVDIRFIDRSTEDCVTVDVKGFRTVRARLQDALIVVERKCARNKSETDPFNGWLHSRALDTIAFRVRLGSETPDSPAFVVLDRVRLLDWALRVVDWDDVHDSGAFYEEPAAYRAVSRRSNAYDKTVRWDLFAYVPLVEAVRAAGVALVGGEGFPPSKQQSDGVEDCGIGRVSEDRVGPGPDGTGVPLEVRGAKRLRLGKD